MKLVFALISLAAIASAITGDREKTAITGDPEDKATFSDTKFYTGKLDSAQGAIEDIGKANARLASKEDQLSDLISGLPSLWKAEKILETAVDHKDYKNTFLEDNLKAE